MALSKIIRVFLAGDVMLGRGIDQLFPDHCDPRIYQPDVMDARQYIQWAADKNGPLPKNVGPAYVWGDALKILQDKQPDFKLINLETAITTSNTPWEGKRYHFHTHPKHVEILQAAEIDCCNLSNNHVIDWGYTGLTETLLSLKNAGIGYVGAGENISEAQKPEIFDISKKGRVIVLGGCHGSSHVPHEWQAGATKPGVNIIHLDEDILCEVRQLANRVGKVKKPGDIVIFSVHWGPNYRWRTYHTEQEFAHAAIDVAGVDVVHGHSSHHVKGIEIYKGKLIMYGCGDLINDYEGAVILDYKHQYHNVRSLMYFADIRTDTGEISDLKMVPTMMKNLRVTEADDHASRWLHDTMDRLCKEFGGGVQRYNNEMRFDLGTDKSSLQMTD